LYFAVQEDDCAKLLVNAETGTIWLQHSRLL